ncbi:MAG: CoA transferase [Dehalococcoidia bacterium]|nr:CoA transferase [Dehalococcoidia bacterium]MCA9852075.1 CoA transferase [Dehalococcoidia bacterium]
MAGALDGIRVLDLSQWQQGPYATVILSDMGADVIKVERPQYGDAGRHALGGYDHSRVAPDFFAHNRGKRGITVELSNRRGREIILKLAETADVVVSNFRIGTMERWGLGYDDLKAVNPGIIYAQATGMGMEGPQAGRPMFDIVAQAMGGIMSVNGMEGAEPTPVGTFLGDQVGATMLALAILGALVARERTGEGQQVDVSLLGSQIGMQSYEITHYLFTGELPKRAGRGHPHSGVLWNTFPASDGHFAMAGVKEDLWPEFCELVHAPDLATDPRFNTYEGRADNRGPLLERLDEIFRARPFAHWVEVLGTLDIAIGPVRNYAEVAVDEQVLANNYISDVDDGTGGRLPMVNTPVGMSKTPPVAQGTAPELGQHTELVLLEAGYDWDEITAFREAGAI